MPNFTRCLLSAEKMKRNSYFLDSLRVYARGGAGGQGLPKYGGIGGNGGNVYVTANEKQTLLSVKQKTPEKRFVAGVGLDSSARKLLGGDGKDIDVEVPLGVTVKTDSGHELGDLNKSGQRLLVAKGGIGGNPDNHFQGHRGQTNMITLDLKLIADIGLVGFPNAGKSTFLAGISRASPKIADYPFTTLRPQIGVMQYDDLRQISVADLPGLIEGAHVNVGLGHRFLKHVERTKLLLFYIDVNGFQLSYKYPIRTPFETIMLLNKELQLYKKHLVDKPAVLAINKVDGDEERVKAEEIIHQITNMTDSLQNIDTQFHPEHVVRFDKIIPISAKYGHGLDEIKQLLRDVLDFHADVKYTNSAKVQLTDDDGRYRSREKAHTRLI